MLRNIPNRVDQAMLKKIVDITSWGRYDFMYLRIGEYCPDLDHDLDLDLDANSYRLCQQLQRRLRFHQLRRCELIFSVTLALLLIMTGTIRDPSL